MSALIIAENNNEQQYPMNSEEELEKLYRAIRFLLLQGIKFQVEYLKTT